MIFNKKYREFTVNVISLLFIVLFVYAAMSKLLDFETFQIQLAQAPLLSAYAGMVSVLVPSIEILLAVLLIIPRFRLAALIGCFGLMVMFTAYIVIILNFSDFVPCSCGGVLEKLSWTEHLFFNISFIILAVVAILLATRLPRPGKLTTSYKAVFLALFIIAAFATLLLTVLFISSEKKIYRNEAFQRKYLPHAAEYLGDYELGSNTYYIAGFKDSIIYLGNLQAPLYLKTLDVSLQHIKDFPVAISNIELPYRRARILVEPPFFFLGDGTVPIIFRGNTTDWKADVFSYNEAYFKQFEIADSTRIGIAGISNTTAITNLGLITRATDRDSVIFNDSIITKQVDGIFDSDGLLLWNTKNKKFLYTYFYRNSYEVTDENLFYKYSGKTIDTVSKAILDIAHHTKKDQYKRGQSVMINKYTATFGDYLFINSDRLGRYEDKAATETAAIIDVYNIVTNSYEFSFYLYHQQNKKLNGFRIYKDILIALVDGRLWIYKLKPEYFDPGSNTTHTGQYQE
ncbi:MauE/DoxX family redox-associated membrane protein [Aequorivita vladivostokensis]|uniref:MauE/DoxX family redox-associated membrane protein n=1 Tax=Aequorivita vladivostokensis TaxID=171194 RepID=UPI0005D310F5|nr:MauE/DoxX family redox-associated membrane protein [Aequorivita vladivostokensis]